MSGELCEGAKEEDSTARENAAARGDRRRESPWRWEEKGPVIERVVKVWKAAKREKKKRKSECGAKRMNEDWKRIGEWIEGWIRGN